MPNYGYHLARAKSRVCESLYRFALPWIVRRSIDPPVNLPIDVFSYSGSNRLAEQVASIRSFLQNAGQPERFIVVSDGTYTANDIRLLSRVDDCVSVEQVPPPGTAVPALMEPYLRTHFNGKQVALLMSLPRERPALYLDSDVLFFAGAAQFGQDVASSTASAYYLEDCNFAADDRLFHEDAEKKSPVNIGVLLFFRPQDWTLTINRFLELRGAPNFFTGQTLVHLAMHANDARPFDPVKYVLQLDDQFMYPDRYAGPDIVLRHYVNPVRHKFWTSHGH